MNKLFILLLSIITINIYGQQLQVRPHQLNLAPLYIDTLNSRVGIGTNTPSALLTVSASNTSTSVTNWNSTARFDIQNTSNTDGNYSMLCFTNSVGQPSVGIIGEHLDADGAFGTGRSGRLHFGTSNPNNSGNIITRLIINEVGNVGIGTTSPFYNLEIINTNNSETSYPLSVTNTNNQAGNGYGAGIKFSTSTPSNGGNESNKWSSIEAFDVNNYGSNSGLSFTVSNSYVKNKAMVINRLGNVGIGTTSPNNRLHIVGSGTVGNFASTSGTVDININHSGNGGKIGYTNLGTNNQSNVFFITTGAGTVGSGLVIDNGGNVGIGTTNPVGKLHVNGGSDASVNDPAINLPNNKIISWFDASGTKTNGAFLWTDLSNNLKLGAGNETRITITSSGNVGIGNITPAYQLELSTNSAAKPTSSSWTVTSDSRVKKNITPYNKGLNVVLQLNPIEYDYNGLGGYTEGYGGIGIIAQEVKPILPEAISSFKRKLNPDDEFDTELLNFDAHPLPFIFINAFKEQQAIIQQQQQQINELLQRIIVLENK